MARMRMLPYVAQNLQILRFSVLKPINIKILLNVILFRMINFVQNHWKIK